MTSTDGTANVDTSSGLERDESTHLAVQQPTPRNSAERTQIALDGSMFPVTGARSSRIRLPIWRNP